MLPRVQNATCQPQEVHRDPWIKEVFTWHIIIPISLIAAVIYLVLPERTISQPPGVLAPHEPIQTPPSISSGFEYEGYRITALADYDITARVLAKLAYRFGGDADLAPIDMVLGWQSMSDSSVVEDFNFTLTGRYYTFNTDTPISPDAINKQLSNHHLIPSSSAIEDQLRDLRVGHLVRMQGYLVSVQKPDGSTWSSSLTRTDDGWGACELFYVRKVEVIK